MRLTVAICTWNRASLLRMTLERMTELVVPAGTAWEILVVNNNCSDDTDLVVAGFQGRLPIRTVAEPAPGKSHALNRAAAEAAGRYILFTDDDVLVEPDWLTGYLAAFDRWPDAALFGGPITPRFDGTPPRWLEHGLASIGPAFAILDLGPVARPFDAAHVPFGANMAIRTDVQRRFHYAADLGPRPGSQLRGEETTLIRDVLKTGATGWWVPEARVRHFIPAERQTLEYIEAYFRGQGEYFAQVAAGPERLWWGRPRWLWRSVVQHRLAYWFHRAVSGPAVWVDCFRLASIDAGRFDNYPRFRA